MHNTEIQRLMHENATMRALLEKAEEALDGCLARLYGELYPNHPETLEVEEALAAIKQWKEQT